MKIKAILLAFLLAFTINTEASPKSGVPFNPLTDIHYDEIQLTFLGFCICPRRFSTVIGLVWTYWEPYIAVDTVTTPFYSPFWGAPVGGSLLGGGSLLDELGGKNASQDSVNIANESTYAQAHVYPIPILDWLLLLCNRYDFPFWLTEFDPEWQFDELSMLIHPEAALYANPIMQMACMADAASTNVGSPLDSMPWCIGSGGSSYPMTGHVDNDNIVQANNTAAARLIYKLNRMLMICDHAVTPCGCLPTPVWIKSNYKMHVVRPGMRAPAWPMGVNAAYYNTGLNAPFVGGSLGPNDEFLWVVYRRQLCCTCCD